MNVTWLTQGAFLFESGATRTLIDPYMSDDLVAKEGLARRVAFPLTLEDTRPDLVVCTHDHADHLDPKTVLALAERFPSCRFAGPASCRRHFAELGVADARVVRLKIGKTVGDTPRLTPVPAFHSDPDAVGVVFHIEGRRFYVTGDTLFDEALVNDFTRNVDALFVCVNGKWGNMGVTEALTLVKRLQPRQAFPMHYGLFEENTADPAPFVAGCSALGVKSTEMTLGKPFAL